MKGYYTEASLSDSFIFNELNRSSNASTTIVKAMRTGTKLDRSYIEEQYIQAKRTRISPLVDEVLEAFDNEEIVLIYNKQVRVSTAIPFVVMHNAGKTHAYIFISDFSGITKDGEALNIEMKRLYTLMETAYIGKIFYTFPNKFKKSGALLKIMANAYASMGMRIFNKEFALSLDKDVYDRVNYCMARFFLENMMEIKNVQVSHAYAVACCLNASKMSLEVVGKEYSDVEIEKIDKLIKFVATISPKMSKLNFRYYFERWISTYGTSACLSIDSVPYLYFVIINVLLGVFLVNTTTLNDLIKNIKQIHLFYPEIKKTVM